MYNLIDSLNLTLHCMYTMIKYKNMCLKHASIEQYTDDCSLQKCLLIRILGNVIAQKSFIFKY